MSMERKLAVIEQRFESLTQRLGDPELVANYNEYRKVAREQAHLASLVEAWRALKSIDEELGETELMLEDEDRELAEMAAAELPGLKDRREALFQKVRRLLLPPDPNDGKNVILEIRAAAGGDEASLFAGDLLKMYTRFGEGRGWRFEQMSASHSEVGGFKEVITLVAGADAWGQLKFEGGVHRVQRVPETESQGRIHTSTVTVALMPEAEEVEVDIDPGELRIDTMRAGGPGGQSVNTTDSAVRIVHKPTGITVICQDEKSQHKNKAKAMRVLRSRLLAAEQEKAHAEQAGARRSQVGTGDRSERIRTYNYPQGRVTDHRIGLTLYTLDRVVNGEMGAVVDALRAHDEAEQLKGQEDEE